MAEDLGEEWWETKTKNSKNDKIEDEGEFFHILRCSIYLNPSGVVEDVPEVLVEDGRKTEKKKKRRKKRKIEEVVDSNEMSSEDKVKEEINDILGLVQKEEISEWIDSASIRLGKC